MHSKPRCRTVPAPPELQRLPRSALRGSPQSPPRRGGFKELADTADPLKGTSKPEGRCPRRATGLAGAVTCKWRRRGTSNGVLMANHYSRATRRPSMTLLGAIGVTVGLVVGWTATPASAAGAPDLGGLILANPEPGWPQDSSASVQPIVSRLEKVDSNAVNGEAVPVAAKVWHSPNHDQLLAITLIQWPANLGDLSNLARTGLSDECVAVSGNDPGSIESVPNLIGSFAAICSSSQSGSQLAVADDIKGNDMEMVESIGIKGAPTLGLATVGTIASTQFDALPAPPTQASGVIAGTVGALLTIGVAVLIVVLVSRKVRKRRTAPPAGPQAWPIPAFAPITGTHPDEMPGWDVTSGGAPPPPQLPPLHAVLAPMSSPGTGNVVGWHADENDPSVQRYWDGYGWSVRVHWDGSAWVKESLSANS